MPYTYYFEKLLQNTVNFFMMSEIEFNIWVPDNIIASMRSLSNLRRLRSGTAVIAWLRVIPATQLMQLPAYTNTSLPTRIQLLSLCNCLPARIQEFDAFYCKGSWQERITSIMFVKFPVNRLSVFWQRFHWSNHF